MHRSLLSADDGLYDPSAAQPGRRLSFLKFLFRYPVFLLALGPPIFRSNAGVDATKGVVDYWAFIQVGWVSLVALRAIVRIANCSCILIPRQIQSILRLAFLLGILFLVSSLYSTNTIVSAAYSILYILPWICALEFIIDIYQNPPDWIQCIHHFRLIAFILSIVVGITAIIRPQIVLIIVPGVGIRLGGGAVAPMTVICPIIAIISAYLFLYSLESKVRSISMFAVGLAGTLVTQSRGAELALFISLAIMSVEWSRKSRISKYLLISASAITALLFGALFLTLGGGRVWNAFNRGQSAQGIASASGRTDVWKFVIQYCMSHPQGMGYIAGFRTIFRNYWALGLQVNVTHIGTSHNAVIDILAGAGWLAVTIYLIFVVMIIALGWRFAKEHVYGKYASCRSNYHAIRCALILYIFCFLEGMDTSEFSIPLRISFYLQIVIIAIILGSASGMIVAYRSRYDINDV